MIPKIDKKIVYGLGGLVALVVFWAVFLRGPGTAKPGDFTLETATVERGDVARLVTASGAVRALTTVEVGSQVSGQIVELDADFNSQVKEGDIIARIDPQTFESRVASAQADIASARASLDVQRANIKSAEASFAQSEKDYNRVKALYDQDAIAKSALEDAERSLAVAKAALDVSRAQLRSSQATLTQRQAALQSAQLDLDRTIIRSPIDGVVIERSVDVGQTVAASFSAPILFQIAQDLGDIRIDAAVVESDIGGIDAGDPATFKVDAYPNETFKGTVEQVRLASETLSNVVTYTVVIAAENRSGRLLPGMTANVEITAEKREGVLRLAESAVRFRPPSDGVTVVSDVADEDNQDRRGRRGGAGGNQADMMLAGLDIDAARKEKIQTEMQAEMEKVRASMGDAGATFDRAGMREKIQSRTDKVLRDNLSRDELAIVQKTLNERAAQRRVDLYQPVGDGTLKTVSVSIGLSDGQNVEILRGAEEGDAFVTRLTVAAADN
ncbi:efflux RND transporter periplasmic adaptor subunit [Hyphomonas johnsonii]|uniref:RND family efflux transporter MFP subunit n=1 Tax=Hyphomonas johnsonii MHS-2 TaxID=1280950 RepID=A0A059FHJ9_9PROT|nr:efflux RND transporter periplasmic adaptor subunit [Hyphomonas johnsonii]KCZ90011.1 RND family efflux transporter MFP subunit [Hyphomonas johnsonii MHS-2]